MPESRSRVVTERSGATATLRPSGELDLASAPALVAAADAALADGAAVLVVDLAGVEFLDSTGLRALLALSDRAAGEGFRLTLLPGSPRVQRVFELTGMVGHLPFEA